MESLITSHHWYDANGNPAGGNTYGHGFAIAWQNGPIIEAGGRNGAFVEDITKAAIDRIEYYQASRFACEENAEALRYLRSALAAMNRRTASRVAALIEGTHRVFDEVIVDEMIVHDVPTPPPTPSKWRKRRIEVEAMRYLPETYLAIREWMGTQIDAEYGETLIIKNDSGLASVFVGDWIIKGVWGIRGEFYPCKHDIFVATYEPEE